MELNHPKSALGQRGRVICQLYLERGKRKERRGVALRDERDKNPGGET